MRNPFALPALLALAGCATNTAQNPLVGAWQIVRYVNTPDQGEPVHPFGDPPGGLFIFTDDGHASIVVARNPPELDKTIADPDPGACVPAWYCSYFGTYRFDPSGPSWTVHVEGGNVPSYVGTDQTRWFRIENGMLTIRDRYTADGMNWNVERVLRKLDDKPGR